jgi:hypothetical protein
MFVNVSILTFFSLILCSLIKLHNGTNVFRNSYKHNHNFIKENTAIEGVTNTFICPTDKCQRIKKFHLSQKMYLCCQERYLPVSFSMLDANNVQVTTEGYLTQGEVHVIELDQKPQTVCQLIKR